MSVRDAYLAGLLDGDGCLSINTYKGDEPRIRIQFAMTKAENVLRELCKEYGGCVFHLKPNSARHQPVFGWALSGIEAEALLRRLEPFLLLKKKQAQLALELQDLKRAGTRYGRGWRLNDTDRQRATEIIAESRQLNAVGII